ncbi:MAG TPA: hypothetical protein DDW94_03185 [Deltaproteobacteria bacterium]|nr:MAG: hypothetical protein A2Z79_09880 [Deltaproteobacteria bacterium GWA2_55_82]OGQ62491.1 MAG: hypothetical protein A3I81_08395 [Deltaproteobacteria bacterium RIFCSPLOWO2_02_FULL_55_12]OIJ73018.1 MAG: hypothetical protein A2V21_301330 [Deltaproteobacteria bacterium GWC2_55_46]HBG45972.1 hypothetical protein [Deltaproteobacteria bacterium]HCY11810.1 hypothetical protein [Deltaproteobacteria bacterium]
MAGRDRGFTLIELVLSITVMGFVAVTLGLLIYQATRSFATLDAQKEIAQQGTLAIERLSRELRLIRCTESGNSCKPASTDITEMTSSEIRFVNTNLEGRGFRLDGSSLRFRDGSGALDPEYVLSDKISSLTFEYLKDDSTAAAATDEVWVINVNMVIASGAESFALKASVHPRSFR